MSIVLLLPLALAVALALAWFWWSSRPARDPGSSIASFHRALEAMQPHDGRDEGDRAQRSEDAEATSRR